MLSSTTNETGNNNVPMFNGKKLKFAQHDKNGYCYTHGYRCTKNHSSKTCTKPGPNHDQDTTYNNTKGESTKNKD